MKKKKKLDYVLNHKTLLFAQFLFASLSISIMSLLMLYSREQQIDLFALIESNLMYNVLYVLSMFDAICFIELFYISKSLKKNEHFESSIIHILCICIIQILLLNMVIGILLALFIRKTLKVNHVTVIFQEKFKKFRLKGRRLNLHP